MYSFASLETTVKVTCLNHLGSIFSMDKPQPYNWPTESETPGVRLACVLQKSFLPV